jgi:uncharacterized protein (TIGR03382 family)
MVDALASTAYLSEGTSNPAILLHGSKDVPRQRGVDAGLSYGDHFFLEALARRAAQTSTDAGAGNPPVPPENTPVAAAGGGGCTSAGTAPFGAAVLLASAMLRRRRRDSEVA